MMANVPECCRVSRERRKEIEKLTAEIQQKDRVVEAAKMWRKNPHSADARTELDEAIAAVSDRRETRKCKICDEYESCCVCEEGPREVYTPAVDSQDHGVCKWCMEAGDDTAAKYIGVGISDAQAHYSCEEHKQFLCDAYLLDDEPSAATSQERNDE